MSKRGQPRTGAGAHTAKLLERNHALVELLILSQNDLLVVTFSDDETCVTPTEVIHAPEGIHWKEETVHRVPVATYEMLDQSYRRIELTRECIPPSNRRA